MLKLTNKEEFLMDMLAYLMNGNDYGRNEVERTQMEALKIMNDKEQLLMVDNIEDELNYFELDIDDLYADNSAETAIGISLDNLYSEMATNLNEGIVKLTCGGEIHKSEIDENNYSFELFVDGDIACYDGEQCIVLSKGDVVTMVNKQGEEDKIFKLSKREFDVAVFN